MRTLQYWHRTVRVNFIWILSDSQGRTLLQSYSQKQIFLNSLLENVAYASSGLPAFKNWREADICAVDLKINQPKSIYSATKASKKATSDNSVVTSKQALSF